MPALVEDSLTRIPAVLQSQGRSMTWLCQKLKLSRSYVWRMERGERPLSADYVNRAAEVLSVPAELLLTDMSILHTSQIAETVNAAS